MNYTSKSEKINDELRKANIMSRLKEHLDESLIYFKYNQVVGIFLQGSQNYGLDLPTSDVDTKLILTPSIDDIVINKKPISTTHVRANDEHTDWKDIRLYMETFRKQNLNFLEILFTEYFIVNPMYEEQWQRLVQERERIARMNTFRAVKSMKGIALEKYHAMEHRYPSKEHLIDQYGYDGKQVHHLCRVEDYLRRYIAGESYKDCLTPSPEIRQFLLDLKTFKYPHAEARVIADESLARVTAMADSFCEKTADQEDEDMRQLLSDVQCEIVKKSIKEELSV